MERKKIDHKLLYEIVKEATKYADGRLKYKCIRDNGSLNVVPYYEKLSAYINGVIIGLEAGGFDVDGLAKIIEDMSKIKKDSEKESNLKLKSIFLIT